MSKRRETSPIPASSPDFRPRDYFGRFDLQTELLTHVKGRARRAAIRDALEKGEINDIPSHIKAAELDNDERQLIGRVHPMFMGGEYLPRIKAEEVEIARISIKSTTYDVTVMYARPVGKRIRYRVVDEYQGDTLGHPRECTSMRPLTMGEMIKFFLGAWDLMSCLEWNYEGDLEGMLGFFNGESEFYPYFDASLREMVRERFQETREEDPPEEEEHVEIVSPLMEPSVEIRLTPEFLATFAEDQTESSIQKVREEIFSRPELWSLVGSTYSLIGFPNELKDAFDDADKALPQATSFASGMARLMKLGRIRALLMLYWRLRGAVPDADTLKRLHCLI